AAVRPSALVLRDSVQTGQRFASSLVPALVSPRSCPWSLVLPAGRQRLKGQSSGPCETLQERPPGPPDCANGGPDRRATGLLRSGLGPLSACIPYCLVRLGA